MNVFEFIDKHVKTNLLSYIRLITLYINDGVVNNICFVRYNDKKISKKAAKLGLKNERNLIEIKPGVKLANPKPYNIQQGSYYLNYDTRTKDLSIYKQ